MASSMTAASRAAQNRSHGRVADAPGVRLIRLSSPMALRRTCGHIRRVTVRNSHKMHIYNTATDCTVRHI
ncbi:hypothetical protein MCEL_10970 [Mycolicibacterium celeriflavum]|uniref:Uncharacterized protein n=1 Tax=Mycolicibacterium celeriflavum TaxID=1249101 RepID=A0A7I7RE06_MYCCF|nr:hypothetical protein MCEL_10970 [Mycolicibacterium celeriflavum]